MGLNWSFAAEEPRSSLEVGMGDLARIRNMKRPWVPESTRSYSRQVVEVAIIGLLPGKSASVHEYVRSNRHHLLWMFRGKNRGFALTGAQACGVRYATATHPQALYFFQCGAILASTLAGMVDPRISIPAATIAAISLCLSSSARSAEHQPPLIDPQYH